MGCIYIVCAIPAKQSSLSLTSHDFLVTTSVGEQTNGSIKPGFCMSMRVLPYRRLKKVLCPLDIIHPEDSHRPKCA